MLRKAFYTTGEVARMMGVSPATIFRAVENGQLKSATTPGGHNRITRKELEDFAKSMGIPPERLGSDKMRILIVEDNMAELRMIQRTFQSDPDFDVQATASGYGAGYLTKAFRPDVILLDIYLGDLDGREVVKVVRADPELRETRILAVTGASDPKEIKDIQACGVDDIVSKPVDAAALCIKVKKLMA
ncbi:MAG: response regulator [Elusimicrobiota bacterium]|jgi:excisionase family DNA binding protein